MSSIFTKIINREIPANIVAETDKYIAFLDVNPLIAGHTLVIPKQEVDYIYDLDDETLSGLHIFAKRVAKSIEEVVDCNRIGVTVIGLEVPHAHIHLVPIHSLSDMNFLSPKLKIPSDQMSSIAAIIKEAYDAKNA